MLEAKGVAGWVWVPPGPAGGRDVLLAYCSSCFRSLLLEVQPGTATTVSFQSLSETQNLRSTPKLHFSKTAPLP